MGSYWPHSTHSGPGWPEEKVTTASYGIIVDVHSMGSCPCTHPLDQTRLPSPRKAARKEEEQGSAPRVQAEDVHWCSLHFLLMHLLFCLVWTGALESQSTLSTMTSISLQPLPALPGPCVGSARRVMRFNISSSLQAEEDSWGLVPRSWTHAFKL